MDHSHGDFIARGEASGRAKLTENDVRQIRARYEARNKPGLRVTLRRLAADYGVSKMQVQRIIHREQWTHL